MLLTLTFNLWILWLFSSDIFCPSTTTAKVISDENMMKQQFTPPSFFILFVFLSLSTHPPSAPPSWLRVIEQWGIAEF